MVAGFWKKPHQGFDKSILMGVMFFFGKINKTKLIGNLGIRTLMSKIAWIHWTRRTLVSYTRHTLHTITWAALQWIWPSSKNITLKCGYIHHSRSYVMACMFNIDDSHGYFYMSCVMIFCFWPHVCITWMISMNCLSPKPLFFSSHHGLIGNDSS